MTKVGNAVRYPFTADRWGRALLVGGLCLAAAPLVLPGLVALGYWRCVAARTLDGSPKAPSIGPPGSALRDGVGVLAVAAPYLLGPAVVGLTVLAITGGAGALTGDAGATLVGGLAGAILGGGLALLLVGPGAYLLPAAAGNALRTGRLRDGFRVRDVRRVALHHSYVRGVLSAAVLLWAGALVGTAAGAALLALALFVAAAVPLTLGLLPAGVLLLAGVLFGGAFAFLVGTAAVRAAALGVVDATPPEVDWGPDRGE